jgi:hypothetical protein
MLGSSLDGETIVRVERRSFHLDLIPYRHAVVIDERDRSLELPRLLDRTFPDGDDDEPVRAIETDRSNVVVGRDQPKTRTAGFASDVRDGLEEKRPVSATLDDGVDGDDLAGVPLDRVREEPHDVSGIVGHDEAGERGGPEHDAVPNHDLAAPTLSDEVTGPRPIPIAERAHGWCHVPGVRRTRRVTAPFSDGVNPNSRRAME